MNSPLLTFNFGNLRFPKFNVRSGEFISDFGSTLIHLGLITDTTYYDKLPEEGVDSLGKSLSKLESLELYALWQGSGRILERILLLLSVVLLIRYQERYIKTYQNISIVLLE